MTGRPFAEVIGDPITHSKSPLIHNFWLEKLGIEADYRATRVTADSIEDYLRDRRSDSDWRGANVTMPLKLTVLPHMQQLSEDAALVGAANVIMPIAPDALGGFNSDVDGVAEPLRRFANASDRSCVQIIGAGGAAPAAAVGAMRAGFGRFDIFVREPARAEAFATKIGTLAGGPCALSDLGPLRDHADVAHVLINATPMGMAGQPEVPIRLIDYPPDTIVFEMVYSPLETGLVSEAKRLGMTVIDGLEMLVGQAGTAFEHFFGVAAPREHDAELRAKLTA